MQSINNVVGKAEKPKRKNQCLAQIKSSIDTTWCSSQRDLRAERNNEQA